MSSSRKADRSASDDCHWQYLVDFLHLLTFQKDRNYLKKLCRVRSTRFLLDTALLRQEADQSVHDGIIRPANQCGGVALLGDQPDNKQRLEVMRECGRWYTEACL